MVKPISEGLHLKTLYFKSASVPVFSAIRGTSAPAKWKRYSWGSTSTGEMARAATTIARPPCVGGYRPRARKAGMRLPRHLRRGLQDGSNFLSNLCYNRVS